MSLAPPLTVDRSPTARISDAFDWLTRHERSLWMAVGVLLVADIALTQYGLANGFVERNPIAQLAIRQAGLFALVGIKVLALGVGVAGRTVLPDSYTAVVPLAFVVPWGAAVFINAALILAV